MGLKWEICFIINILLALSPIIVMAQPSIGQKCGFNRTETYNDLIYSEVEQPNEISPFQNRSSMTIPVVFHLVLTDNPARISDEMILRQLNYLNQDFQGSNPDRSKVPDHFKNLVGNSSIRFLSGLRRSRWESSYWNSKDDDSNRRDWDQKRFVLYRKGW